VASAKQHVSADCDLVAAMAAGDSEALRSLSARYSRALSALARRFLSDQSDAEEVVADVLWQAWHDAKTFDAKRGSVSVWLVMLARSRAIDRLRSNRARQLSVGQQSDLESPPDPAMEVYQAQRARIVRKALAELDSNERATLELAYFTDLPQSEVAEKLGIPLGTVKTRMRSAMMKLREKLARQQR